MLNLPVSEFMNDHPIKVPADISIRNIAHLVMRYRINGVVVVDPQDQSVIRGVFTTSDLVEILNEALDCGAQKIQALNLIADHPVSEFLSDNFVSLQKDDSAAKAIALIHKKNVFTIPVFDGKELIGVVGRHDVINIAFA